MALNPFFKTTNRGNRGLNKGTSLAGSMNTWTGPRNSLDWIKKHLGLDQGTPRIGSRNTLDWIEEHLGLDQGTPWTGSRNILDWIKENLGHDQVTPWTGLRNTLDWIKEHLGLDQGTPWAGLRNTLDWINLMSSFKSVILKRKLMKLIQHGYSDKHLFQNWF